MSTRAAPREIFRRDNSGAPWNACGIMASSRDDGSSLVRVGKAHWVRAFLVVVAAVALCATGATAAALRDSGGPSAPERLVAQVRWAFLRERTDSSAAAFVDSSSVLHPHPERCLFDSAQADCQDRVAFELGRLSRRHVPAAPALVLRRGRAPGPSSTPGDFDHVLIYASAERRWIDPTEPLSRSVGRWILVCDDRPRWVKYGW